MSTQKCKFKLTKMFKCSHDEFSPQKSTAPPNKFAFHYLDILPETGCGTHDETTGCPKMWWPHTAASRHIDLLCWYTASKGSGSGWAASSHLLCGLWDIDSPQAVSDSPVVPCSPADPCGHGMTYPVTNSSYTATSWHESMTRVVAIDRPFLWADYFPPLCCGGFVLVVGSSHIC